METEFGLLLIAYVWLHILIIIAMFDSQMHVTTENK